MTDESHHDRSIRSRQTVRIVVWVAIAAILVALALSNTEDVTVDWLFGDVDTSLWVVIVVAAAIGAMLGALARRRRD